MRTVKQVSDLTGISVRTLHYYDEIGLLKPSKITGAKYRLYDNEALEVLQQILFFKELEFPLKEVKEIMANPHFDKIHALEKHKKLLILKRKRLDDLIELVNKTLKGENTVSFKEFDMSAYFNALEDFKEYHTDEIIKYWHSVDEFEKMTEKMKTKEQEIAQMAIKQFGSIEKYTEAMKKNLNNFSSVMEGMNEIKENSDYYVNKSKEIMERLTSDLSRDPSTKDIQLIVQEMVDAAHETEIIAGMDMGDNYWGLIAELYLTNAAYQKVTDKQYGIGASVFIGNAIKHYCNNCDNNK